MEAATTYFTKRARQERTSAVDADSAEARTAHLELALRLVSIATNGVLQGSRSERERIASQARTSELSRALHNAYPLSEAVAFEYLLEPLDR